ncbi:MAG: YdgA family protein, partial [Sinobacteraceae bacterium]|nr:YdgA family protein [Nevskiaceae bacterium]
KAMRTLMGLFRRVHVKGTAFVDTALTTHLPKTMRAELGQALQRGWVVLDGKQYNTRVDYSRGQLKINGKAPGKRAPPRLQP